MIQGKNTNVDYKDRVIHVQTEYIKSKKVILTLIFDKGAIVGSKKKKLIFNSDHTRYIDKINKKLLKQHKEVVNRVKKSGKTIKDEAKMKDNKNDDLMKDFLNEVFDFNDKNT